VRSLWASLRLTFDRGLRAVNPSHTYLYVYIYTYIYIHKYKYTHVYLYLYIMRTNQMNSFCSESLGIRNELAQVGWLDIYTYIHICAYLYTYIYICIYLHTYLYIDTYIQVDRLIGRNTYKHVCINV